jgi:hypothetical protein
VPTIWAKQGIPARRADGIEPLNPMLRELNFDILA